MRSTILLVVATVLCAAVFVAAQSAPAYPPTADQSGSNGMCLLDGLTLTGGSLGQAFGIQTFQYDHCVLNSPNSLTLSAAFYDSSSHADVYINGNLVAASASGNGLTSTSPSFTFASSSFNAAGANNRIQLLVNCMAEAQSGMDVCQYQYVLNCASAAPPSSGGFVVGDPQFIGLRGQNYQVHGVSGEIYNIVSDSDLQYNSRFVFLEQGKCPVVNGKKQKGCWSHPGSYLGELGLKTKSGDKIHLETGPANVGFGLVEVNGKAMQVGESVMLADDMGSVSLNSTHLASVQIGNWDFAFENSDMFVNQRVRVLDARGLRSHGLLGQTWRETTYPNQIKYIQGTVDDYVIRDDNDIFGDNFVFNQYN